MSEQEAPEPCIRGCTKPATGDTPGDPRPASIGHLCARDAKRLREWLRQIPDLYAVLDTRKATGTVFATGKRSKLSGSPALIRLDVAVLQDPRSTSGATYKGETVHEPEDINDPPSSTPSQYIAYADSLTEDLNLRTPDNKPLRHRTLTDAINTLTGPWYTNLCYRPWIEDLYDDTHTTQALLRRTSGISPPRPLGKCQCGNTLYEPEPTPDREGHIKDNIILECRKCGHRLNGLAVTRLANAQRVTKGTA